MTIQNGKLKIFLKVLYWSKWTEETKNNVEQNNVGQNAKFL